MNNKITAAAIIIIVGAGAFFGGMVYQKKKVGPKNFSREGNVTQRGNMPDGQNRGSGIQQGRQNRNGGNFLGGEILSKDEKSITIKLPDGGSKIVYFSDSTAVGKTIDGSSSDLSIGQQVMVNGTANPDGSVAAENVQIRPEQK